MRPHDLLRLKAGARLMADDVPEWVGFALRDFPFVVVRRAAPTAGLVAIGVRGSTRDKRFAAAINASDVADVFTPESLASDYGWRNKSCRDMPAFAALDNVAQAARSVGLPWGPGGSAGFELATGACAVTARSDLDIVIRPTARHTRDDLQAFRDAVADSAVRVDIVIETAQGAVALDEWLASSQYVLIKTTCGPTLGAFSW